MGDDEVPVDVDAAEASVVHPVKVKADATRTKIATIAPTVAPTGRALERRAPPSVCRFRSPTDTTPTPSRTT